MTDKNQLGYHLQQAQNGHQSGMIAIYDYFYPKLFNYCLYRTVNVHASEDIVSNVFLKLIINLEKLKPRTGSLHAWVFSVTSNEIANFYRKENKYSVLDNLPTTQADLLIDRENSEIQQAVEKDDLIQKLHQQLKKLKPDQQKVIFLKYFVEKNTPEIAAEFGIKDSSVRSLLARSLAKLKSLI